MSLFENALCWPSEARFETGSTPAGKKMKLAKCALTHSGYATHINHHGRA
jgi:hypothetical protein